MSTRPTGRGRGGARPGAGRPGKPIVYDGRKYPSRTALAERLAPLFGAKAPTIAARLLHCGDDPAAMIRKYQLGKDLLANEHLQPSRSAPPSPPTDDPGRLTAILRQLVTPHFDEQRRLQQRIERKLQSLEHTLGQHKETLDGVLRHQVGIAREVGAVEHPRAPRGTRRRPLGE